MGHFAYLMLSVFFFFTEKEHNFKKKTISHYFTRNNLNCLNWHMYFVVYRLYCLKTSDRLAGALLLCCRVALWQHLLKMTVVVPLSIFLRFKAELFFNSFRAVTLLRDKLYFGLVTVTSSSGAFDTFQVALIGNTSLNRWRELLPNFTFVCYGCWDKFETLW